MVQKNAKSIIRQIRDAGFVLELDDNDKPTVSPLNRLTAEQRAILKTHRELIQDELRRERVELIWLNPWDNEKGEQPAPSWRQRERVSEQAEYERLCAWWLTWKPPVAPYQLDSATYVTDPQKNHAYYAARIKEGCCGQVQRSVADYLRRHWRMFGGSEG